MVTGSDHLVPRPVTNLFYRCSMASDDHYLSCVCSTLRIPLSDIVSYADKGDYFVVVLITGQKCSFQKELLDSQSSTVVPHRGRPRKINNE